MAFNILPLQSLVSFEIAKMFWNASFNIENLHLEDCSQMVEPNWDIKLTECSKKAIDHLNVFIRKRMLPQAFKTPLKENIILFQKAYHKLLLWRMTYDPDNNINLFQEGDLYAPNYFTIEGEFNDVVWAQRFVFNPNCGIIQRFRMACLFWFENECENLLSELKEFYRISFGENINLFRQDVFEHNSKLVQLLLLHLENNRLNSPDIEVAVREGFWQMAFNHTVKKGYEHAVYFIWQKLSDFQKHRITHGDGIFHLICLDTKYPKDNISYFLFSQLSEERKNDFLRWSVSHERQIYDGYPTETWLSLLLPLYGTAMHSEILEFIYQLPIVQFSVLLQSLSNRIKKCNLPLDTYAFQVLWSKLSSERRHEVLERGVFIFENLVKAKSLYNLCFIIKGLSFEQKERCLLHGLYGAGMDSLNILKNACEFDMLQKYLSFFLIDMDSCTQTHTLSRDSISLLQTFIDSSEFKRWCKVGGGLEKLVMDRIDTLLTSATLLDELCESVCEEVIISQSPSRVSDLKTHRSQESEFTLSSSSSHKRKLD